MNKSRSASEGSRSRSDHRAGPVLPLQKSSTSAKAKSSTAKSSQPKQNTPGSMAKAIPGRKLPAEEQAPQLSKKQKTGGPTHGPSPAPGASSSASSSSGPVLPVVQPQELPAVPGNDSTLPFDVTPTLETDEASTLPFEDGKSFGSFPSSFGSFGFYQGDEQRYQDWAAEVQGWASEDEPLQEHYSEVQNWTDEPVEHYSDYFAEVNEGSRLAACPAERTELSDVDILWAELSKLPNAEPDEHLHRPQLFHSVSGPWTVGHHFYMDLLDGSCYRVDTETDNLTEEEVIRYWREVEIADRKELTSFVTESIFELCHIFSAKVRPMDAVWVRKKKRMPSSQQRKTHF